MTRRKLPEHEGGVVYENGRFSVRIVRKPGLFVVYEDGPTVAASVDGVGYPLDPDGLSIAIMVCDVRATGAGDAKAAVATANFLYGVPTETLAAAEIGRKGGLATTPAKAAAARANGRKPARPGRHRGRPRKGDPGKNIP